VEPFAIPDKRERVSADTRTCGLNDSQKGRGRNGGIHGIAAIAKDVEARLGGERLARGYHPMRRKHGLVLAGPDQAVKIDVHGSNSSFCHLVRTLISTPLLTADPTCPTIRSSGEQLVSGAL
jgi:hypothetical protein